MIRFSTLQEASEYRLVSSDYLCSRKRWLSTNRFKRTRLSVALTKITLLLPLLRRHLSDNTWAVILLVPSITALRAQATRSSSSNKAAKLVGGPYIGQGAVPLCSRTPVVMSRERSTQSGVSVAVMMVGAGVSQGSHEISG